MSNLLLGRNPAGRTNRPSSDTVIIRPARREEVHDALRLILGPSGELASEEQVVDFLRFAVYRKIDLQEIWLAETQSRMLWAILPVVSPGRTMLLFTPTHVPDGWWDVCIIPLIERVVERYQARSIELAQVLLDPDDKPANALFQSRGFEMLAQLVYLERDVRRSAEEAPPAGMRWQHYSDVAHARFARTIAATYEGSLDCPRLNGRRDIEDVLAGHKAAGEFDANLWFLLTRVTPSGDDDAGVALLSRSCRSDALELVYLGVTSGSRGQGLGDLLMRRALSTAWQTGSRQLTLAVDSRNTPALNLYRRHGMKRVCARNALIRDLSLINSSTIHPQVR